jgi:hypothetical protein
MSAPTSPTASISASSAAEHPDHVEGNALFNSCDFVAAIQKYQSAIAANDANHRARHNIALCYQKLNKHADALEAVNRAIQKAATGKYFKTRGNIYFVLGRIDEADGAFDEAKRLGENVDEGKALIAKKRAGGARAGGVPSSGGGGGGGARGGSGGGARAGGEPQIDRDGGVMFQPGPDGFPLAKLPVPEARLDSLFSSLAILRLVVVLSLIAYLLPLGLSAATTSWRVFFVACIVAHAISALRENGQSLPATLSAVLPWLQRFAVANIVRQDCPSFILACFCAFSSVPPPLLMNLALVPVGVTHLFYVLEFMCDDERGPLASAKAVAAPLAAIARFVSNKIEPSAPIAGADRRNKLYRALVQLSAHCEVAVFFSSVALLLTPRRNFIAVIALFQVLQLRVLFSTYARASFSALDAAVSTVVRHPRCPAAVTNLYETAKGSTVAFVKGLLKESPSGTAASAAGGAGGGGVFGAAANAAKNCAIM